MKSKPTSALILLSGGQDSTTCLAWALKNFKKVYAIAFDYGQTHKIELKSAQKIAKLSKIHLKIQKISLLKDLATSALTDKTLKITNLKINKTHPEKTKLPSTFVPGRNLIFLSAAAIYAHQISVNTLITGVCQTDYSGYPDCRDDFVKSLEKTINLAFGSSQNSKQAIKILTPLMWLTKAETVKLMANLGQLELLKHSHTCYKGLRPACGQCPACKLRLKGFQEARVKDPLKYARHNKPLSKLTD